MATTYANIIVCVCGTLARVSPLPEGVVGGHARKHATHADANQWVTNDQKEYNLELNIQHAVGHRIIHFC